MKYHWRGPKLSQLRIPQIEGMHADGIDMSAIIGGEVTFSVNRGHRMVASVTLPLWAVYRPATQLWTAPNGRAYQRATGWLVPNMPDPGVFGEVGVGVAASPTDLTPEGVGYGKREFRWGYRPPRMAATYRGQAAAAVEFRQLGLKAPVVTLACRGDEKRSRIDPASVLREKARRAWKDARRAARAGKMSILMFDPDPVSEVEDGVTA
jgi:hypothetical protein